MKYPFACGPLVLTLAVPMLVAQNKAEGQVRKTMADNEPAAIRKDHSIPQPTADERIQHLVSAISEDRLHSIVVKLAGFGTRETLSDTSSNTRGIGAARQWIFDELKRSSPKLQV